MMNYQDPRDYGKQELYNNRTLIAERAIRSSLKINGTATVTINSDVAGTDISPRYVCVGPVQLVVENHGTENGFLLSSYGFQASTMVDGTATQIFVPFEAVMQVVDHKTREVHVVYAVLCQPIVIGEHPTGRRN